MDETKEATGGEILPMHRMGRELESQGLFFEFDMRRREQPDAPGATFKCGNCGKRMPRTNDPETDHHTAMKHHVEECRKVDQARDEHRQLVRELADERRAIAAPTLPLLAAPRRAAWWKFWK